jgi:hypothetical protein
MNEFLFNFDKIVRESGDEILKLQGDNFFSVNDIKGLCNDILFNYVFSDKESFDDKIKAVIEEQIIIYVHCNDKRAPKFDEEQ